MNTRVAEECVLFLNVAKWLVLAIGAGLLVGLSTTIFLTILSLILSETERLSYPLLLLPFGLALSAWMTTSLAPDASGQGVERVIQAVHLRSGFIQAQVIPVKLVATLLTIGAGGSAGNVGPCAQIGGGISSWAAQMLKFSNEDRKTLVICGISAGFASVLGAPIAGAFFGVEALFVGAISYQVLLPSVVAAIVAHQVTQYFQISFWTTHLKVEGMFDHTLLLWSIGGGIVFGLCALLLIEAINLGRRVAFRATLPFPLLGFLAGLVLLGFTSLTSTRVLGLGEGVIQEVIAGQEFLWYAFLLKIITTSLTLNFGGSGGIILPICFIGATVGSAFGHAFDLDPGQLAALGMVGVLAGAVNTPITAVLLALELFGVTIGSYAMLTCVVSFLMSGHRSAIPTQLLRLRKAPGIRADLNHEISETRLSVDPWDVHIQVIKEKIKGHMLIRKKRLKP